MGVFDDLIETAHELINENGQKVTWRQYASGPNADPWKAGAASYVEYKPTICFVPASNAQWRKLLAYLKGTEVPTGRLAGLMAPQKFKPALSDVIIRGDRQLRIENIDVLQPNDQIVLYTLELLE